MRASEDDCWERRSWHWNDKVGGAGEIGVVGGDSSWELLLRDKLLKGGDGWVGRRWWHGKRVAWVLSYWNYSRQ